MPECHAFIDTCIFLHYKPFDDLDWLTILGVKSAAVVLAPITLSELNDHKDQATPRLRQRALSVLKKLDALWSKGEPCEVRPGVELVLQAVEPSIDYLAHQLDHRPQDDRLLAAIIQSRESNAEAKQVLVTADSG